MARCLVTGSEGFIASHLCEALMSAGHDVVGYVQYNSELNAGWLEGNKDIEKLILGDIRSRVAPVHGKFDYVFHLAALVDVHYSYLAPQAYYETNVLGTHHIATFALENGAKLIHTSTSEVYGSAQYTPMDEKHPIAPQSPYAASKVGADALVRSYHLSYGLPAVILRPFNTYGPRQSERAVIPRIIKQALDPECREITLGNLMPKRDWMHVEDTCRAFLAVMDLDFDVYNAGTGESVAVGAVPSYITSKPPRSDPERFRPEDSEVDELRCDYSKLESETGWHPTVSLADGLKKTFEWYAARR